MKIDVVMGIVRPRQELGIDWGVERDVLVRLMGKDGAEKELWYMTGFKYWSGRGEQFYSRAEVSLVSTYSWCSDKVIGGGNTKRDMLFEGRFSVKKIREHAKEIDHFFGVEMSSLIQRGRTVVIQ